MRGLRTGRLSGRARRGLAVAMPAWLLLAMCAASGALAAAGPEHEFKEAVTSSGACAFTEPGDVSVSEGGDAYVYDRGKNRLDVLGPGGACIVSHKIGTSEIGEATDEGVAVDDSGGASAGDVYVFAPEEKAMLKFKLEGSTLKSLRKFKKWRNETEAITEEFGERGEIYGLDVDAEGHLWVYTSEGVLYEFSVGETVTLLSETETFGACEPEPGFAVAPHHERFYLGRQLETRTEGCLEEDHTLARTNIAGEPLNGRGEVEGGGRDQLDTEDVTGAVVDPGSGDIYFDNGDSIAAFAGNGQFIQRFGLAGPGSLHGATGIGLDPATGQLTAASAAEPGLLSYYDQAAPAVNLPPVQHTLADGRGYEQVSPQNKLGAALYPLTLQWGQIEAAEGGEAIAYTAAGPVVPSPPSVDSPEPTMVIARRSPGGWSSQDVATPRAEKPTGFAGGTGSEYRAFSSDISSGFVEPNLALANPHERPLAPEATETTVYERNLTVPSSECEPTPSGCYQALVSPLDDTTGDPFGADINFLAATPDGRYAVVHSTVALTAEAKAAEGLYEWSSQAPGALKLVSSLPAGETLSERASVGIGAVGQNAGGMQRDAISPDGNRLVWSSSENAGEQANLYVHDVAKDETLRIDVARGAPQPEEDNAEFWAAGAGEEHIFFTDTQPLLPDATIEEGSEETEGYGDLYECTVTETPEGKLACSLTDLTASSVGTPARVQGVIGASEDGDTVYFVADGALESLAGDGGCVVGEPDPAVPATCTLYRDHLEGATWHLQAVATLTTEDLHDWDYEVESGGLARMTARVSPDGEYLAFMSSSELTGYDNVDASTSARGAHDEEVFLFDAATRRITCVSCNPGGGRPHGFQEPKEPTEAQAPLFDKLGNWGGRWVAANIPGWTSTSAEKADYQSRYLSDSGRMFFNSVDPLVPADVNGVADVYEYEPAGVGSCSDANGCISLISSGDSQEESAFLDASASGDDVFFLTAEPLAKSDVDDVYDVYDARVCGSSGCVPPPPGEEHPCAEEGCKPPPSTVEAEPGAPATTAASEGNVPQLARPAAGGTPKPKPKPTSAELLNQALKKCKKLERHRKRAACERAARKKYGKKPSAKGRRARRATRARSRRPRRAGA